ncbi:MAG: pseudaminic acid cytidylyltransferase [Oleispira sp.]|jgi:pseudaminic acid cytidylyltransferase
MKIAVIPARGGSKRIPFKNIKEFMGKPMIARSIEAAKRANIFDKIIVSTDDENIAKVARSMGVLVPFMRPDELSDDYAGTTEVIAHATRWAMDNGWDVEYVCCIYATAPFLSSEDLVSGAKKIEEGGWEYCFSATDFGYPVARALTIGEDDSVAMFNPENFTKRSQDLPEAYHDAGQFYWGKASAWVNELLVFSEHSSAIKIPRWRVQDIDTLDDWIRAEMMAEYLLK